MPTLKPHTDHQTMTKKAFSFCSILIILTGCFGEKSRDELILGSWELKEGDVKLELIMCFNEDGFVDIDQGGFRYRAKYEIKDEKILYLGKSIYTIKTLNNKNFIFVDDNPFGKRESHFIKSNKKIEPVPENEEIIEKYSNGKIKIKGNKHNGWRDGKWIEYHENGAIRAITIYDDEMIIEDPQYYDENGKELNSGEYYFRYKNEK